MTLMKVAFLFTGTTLPKFVIYLLVQLFHACPGGRAF